jgi:hypothetical protein
MLGGKKVANILVKFSIFSDRRSDLEPLPHGFCFILHGLFDHVQQTFIITKTSKFTAQHFDGVDLLLDGVSLSRPDRVPPSLDATLPDVPGMGRSREYNTSFGTPRSDGPFLWTSWGSGPGLPAGRRQNPPRRRWHEFR